MLQKNELDKKRITELQPRIHFCKCNNFFHLNYRTRAIITRDNTIIGTKNIFKYRTFFLKGLAQKCLFAEKIVVYCIKIITKGKCSHLISEDGQNYHRKKKN